MIESHGERRPPFKTAAALVYSAALIHGLCLVSILALSRLYMQTFGLTESQYGAVFLPELTCSVIGAISGGILAKRIGLRWLLIVCLAASSVSQLLLTAPFFLPQEFAYTLILSAMAFMGLGFGLSGAPINTIPALIFPRRSHSAVGIAHTLIGLGMAVGPLIADLFIVAGHWEAFPWLLFGLAWGLIVASSMTAFPRESTSPSDENEPEGANMGARGVIRHPMFWGFIAIALLYAFAEGTFANWIVIYLVQVRQLDESVGQQALSAFWGSLVVGRLLVSALVVGVPPQVIWFILPMLMVLAFLSLPFADDHLSAIVLFGFGGLACSAFFPLSLTLAAERFSLHRAWVSSMMIAALMVGVGIGTFFLGHIRELFSFQDIYRGAALYPLAALILAMTIMRPWSLTRA